MAFASQLVGTALSNQQLNAYKQSRFRDISRMVIMPADELPVSSLYEPAVEPASLWVRLLVLIGGGVVSWVVLALAVHAILRRN